MSSICSSFSYTDQCLESLRDLQPAWPQVNPALLPLSHSLESVAVVGPVYFQHVAPDVRPPDKSQHQRLHDHFSAFQPQTIGNQNEATAVRSPLPSQPVAIANQKPTPDESQKRCLLDSCEHCRVEKKTCERARNKSNSCNAFFRAGIKCVVRKTDRRTTQGLKNGILQSQGQFGGAWPMLRALVDSVQLPLRNRTPFQPTTSISANESLPWASRVW